MVSVGLPGGATTTATVFVFKMALTGEEKIDNQKKNPTSFYCSFFVPCGLFYRRLRGIICLCIWCSLSWISDNECVSATRIETSRIPSFLLFKVYTLMSFHLSSPSDFPALSSQLGQHLRVRQQRPSCCRRHILLRLRLIHNLPFHPWMQVAYRRKTR